MNFDTYVALDIFFLVLNIVLVLAIAAGFVILVLAAIRYLKRTKK